MNSRTTRPLQKLTLTLSKSGPDRRTHGIFEFAANGRLYYKPAMGFIFKVLITYLLVSLAALVAMQNFGVSFGTIDYWDVRGFFFLVFVAIFPRLTLLFSSVAFGGVLWWLGWIFAPRLLVALLATVAYWQTNPVLVTIAWLIAVGGETGEKCIVIDRRRRRYSHYGRED